MTVPPLESLYSPSFFLQRTKYAKAYRFFAQELWKALRPASVLDVGCGAGYLLDGFKKQGVEKVFGLEGSAAALPFVPRAVPVLRANLEQVLNNGPLYRAALQHARWDLTCCVEVAEHLEEKWAASLVEFLIGAAIRAVFFTAAPPRDVVPNTGIGHVNEQLPGYWITLFEERGWHLNRDMTEDWQSAVDGVGCPWVINNAMIFQP